MARASRSFTLATQASIDEESSGYEPLEYTFTDPDAKPEKGRKTVDPRICTAHHPGEGMMFAMAASVGMSDAKLLNPAGALVKFLRAAFSAEDFGFIWKQVELSRLKVRDPDPDTTDVMDLVADMMETWSGVPSQQ